MPNTSYMLNRYLPSEGSYDLLSPSRDQILASAEKLRSESGLLQLLFKVGKKGEESMVEIYIVSENGEYFKVDWVFGKSEMILVDIKLPIPKTPVESNLKVGESTENCLLHNTVTDFDTVLKALEIYMDTNELLDVGSYTWINIVDKKFKDRF